MRGVRRRHDQEERCFEEHGRGRRMAARADSCGSWAPPNKRMHATRDTNLVMLHEDAGGRVMRGVRRRYDVKAVGLRGAQMAETYYVSRGFPRYLSAA